MRCCTRSALAPDWATRCGSCEFTTENSEGIQQQVLPTYGVLLAQAGMAGDLGDFDRALLVHAEQSIELHQPLPVAGTLRSSAIVTGIYDKGSGALVQTENKAVDAATGEPMVTTRSGTFIRGEGGFGGDRGTAAILGNCRTGRPTTK